LGPRAAVTLARVMLVDASRKAQLPYTDLLNQAQHGDDLVLRAQTLLLSNLTRAPIWRLWRSVFTYPAERSPDDSRQCLVRHR
jgi:hypothetical protein